jgi:hypothetical protein
MTRTEKEHHEVDTGVNSSGSSFAGEFTRVEIGHMVMGSAGYGTSRSRGSGSTLLSQRS